MIKITTFDELYNISISIIENGNNTFADYSVIEIIPMVLAAKEYDTFKQIKKELRKHLRDLVFNNKVN